MLRLKIFVIVVLLVTASCGCKQQADADGFSKVQKKLFELKSYKCTAEIDINSNKNTTHYVINQYYIHPGKFRVEVNYPEILKGLVIVGNGKYVSVQNSNVSGNNRYTAESISNITGNNSFITEFFSNYVKSEKSEMAVKDGKYMLSTDISGGNSYMEKEVLIIKPSGYPESLKIYDQKGTLKFSLIYKEFISNPKLDMKLFECITNQNSA